MAWLISALNEKVGAIDWNSATQDVARFLNPSERKSLELWSPKFFSSRIAAL
jgi:hypothetical protein